jgi:hypothetical protein
VRWADDDEGVSRRPRGRLDDFADSNAEVLVQYEDFAASDPSTVDIDVDGITGGLVEFDHGIRRETKNVLDKHLGPAKLDPDFKLNVIKQSDGFVHGTGTSLSRQVRKIRYAESIRATGPISRLADPSHCFRGAFDGLLSIV